MDEEDRPRDRTIHLSRLTSRGEAMAQQGKHSNEGSEPVSTGSLLSRLADQSQLDFEVDFYGGILERNPCYVDVLRAHGNNLTLKGRYAEGMQIDKRLVQLRPNDPLAHYNLACSFALLKRPDHAIKTLRRAVELGYRDFRYMKEDRDLDSIRHDPRFRQLMREYENR
jgi:tetratricopeptide (TPR) repeat protein